MFADMLTLFTDTLPLPRYLFIIALLGAVLVGFLLHIAVARRPRTKSVSKPAPRASAGRGRVELYVGNLSYDMKDKDLSKLFEVHGKVLSARIIKNRFNGKSKGYGFVEMADAGEAHAAVKALNGKDANGRKIVVNEAKSNAREE